MGEGDLNWLLRRRETLRDCGEDDSQLDAQILEVRRHMRWGRVLQIGDAILGRYVLDSLLGSGGFGSVWRARDRHAHHRIVAVKVLHGHHVHDQSRVDRFFRGAHAMCRLSSPHIVAVLDPRVKDGDQHCFVMEYVDGGDVGARFGKGDLSVSAALDLMEGTAKGLAECHELGMVHRDVHPGNILVARGQTPKLSDFDLVLAPNTTGGTGSGPLGKVLFAAPECLEDATTADSRSDVYSLAMTGAAMLLGRTPSLPEVYQPGGIAALLPVSPAVRECFSRALSQHPDQRQADANRWLAELQEARKAAPEHGKPLPPTPTPSVNHDKPELAFWRQLASGTPDELESLTKYVGESRRWDEVELRPWVGVLWFRILAEQRFDIAEALANNGPAKDALRWWFDQTVSGLDLREPPTSRLAAVIEQDEHWEPLRSVWERAGELAEIRCQVGSALLALALAGLSLNDDALLGVLPSRNDYFSHEPDKSGVPSLWFTGAAASIKSSVPRAKEKFREAAPASIHLLVSRWEAPSLGATPSPRLDIDAHLAILAGLRATVDGYFADRAIHALARPEQAVFSHTGLKRKERELLGVDSRGPKLDLARARAVVSRDGRMRAIDRVGGSTLDVEGVLDAAIPLQLFQLLAYPGLAEVEIPNAEVLWVALSAANGLTDAPLFEPPISRRLAHLRAHSDLREFAAQGAVTSSVLDKVRALGHYAKRMGFTRKQAGPRVLVAALALATLSKAGFRPIDSSPFGWRGRQDSPIGVCLAAFASALEAVLREAPNVTASVASEELKFWLVKDDDPGLGALGGDGPGFLCKASLSVPGVLPGEAPSVLLGQAVDRLVRVIDHEVGPLERFELWEVW